MQVGLVTTIQYNTIHVPQAETAVPCGTSERPVPNYDGQPFGCRQHLVRDLPYNLPRREDTPADVIQRLSRKGKHHHLQRRSKASWLSSAQQSAPSKR